MQKNDMQRFFSLCINRLTHKISRWNHKFHQRFPKFVAASLAIFLAAMTLIAFDPISGSWAATTDSCNGSSTQNQLTVTASHGTVFYIDSATSEKMDAAYLSYVVSGVSGASTKSNLWVEVSNFQGGSVDLTTPDDSVQSVGTIAASTSKTAFFLVRATSPTLRAQTHVVKVYSGKPGLSSTTELYSCTFTFSKVKETIKANANKVTAVTTTPSTTSNLPLGSTFDVTVTGDTGTIGSGSSPDSDMMWISPVARSSWPSQAIRLESSVIKFSDTANGVDNCTSEGTCKFTNQLLITGMLAKANAIKNNAKSLNYKATYTFRIIGKTAAGVPILPIAQIASGTQTKHTPIPSTALNSVASDTISINATLSKSASSTVTNTVSGGTTTQNFSYTLTLNNSGTGPINVDQLVDAKDSRLSYKASTITAATYPGSSGGSATNISAIEPSLDSSTGKLVFAGPYTVPANSRLVITYGMSTTCVTGSFSYTNSATASIGALTIGSSATTFSQVVAAGTCGDTTITPQITNPTLLPEDVTLNASNVADTTATLNATVDPNGISGGTIQFLYGTDPTLASNTVVSGGTTTSATTPYAVSANLTSLSTATRYYFRVKTTVTISGTTSSQYGDILSFLTTEPAGTPTIQTDPASGVSASTATINGTIDPNLTTSYAGFTIGTNSNLSGGTSHILRADMTSGVTGTNPYDTFGGSFPTPITLNVTDVMSLSANTTYYYRADIYNSAGAVLYSGAIRSFKTVVYSNQTISFNSISSQTLSTANLSISPTASSTLIPSVTSETPLVCTVSSPSSGVFTVTFVSVGDCTLDANQDGGLVGSTNYYAATTVVQTFSITRASRTLTIDSGSFSSSYTDWSSTPPQLTSTASAGNTDGNKTFTIPSTTTICEIDSTTGVVTFLKPGTCTAQAFISQGNTYEAATSSTVSFTIGKKAQVLSLTSTSQSVSTGTYSLSASSNALTNTTGLGAYSYSFTPATTSTANCSITSSTLSFGTTGFCYVTATRTGNDFWTDASTNATITITSKLSRGLTLKAANGGSTVDLPTTVADWSVAAPIAKGVPDYSDTGDTYTYSLDPSSSGCSVNSSTGAISYIGAGTCKIISSVSEGSTYNAATSLVASIVIGKKTQLLSNISDGTEQAPNGHINLGATSNANTADSGMPASVSYSIADGSTEGCAISGTQVTFTKAGICRVTASRNGNANWTDATTTVEYTITRGTRGLNLSNYSSSYADWNTTGPVLVATSDFDDNDGGKTFSIDGTSTVCTVDSVTGVVSFTGAGTCRVLSSIGQGNRYNSAISAVASFTVGKRAQTLTFADGNIAVSAASTSLTASTDALTLNSGLGSDVFTLDTSFSNTIGCSVSGNTLSFTSQGDCYVKVSKSGNTHWENASKTAHFVINGKLSRQVQILKKTETNLESNASSSYDENGYSDWGANAPTLVPYVAPGDRDSGDSYTFSVENDSSGCEVNANTGVTRFTGAGICKVRVTVSEGSVHNSATSSIVSFAIGKQTQHITGLSNSTVLAPTNSTSLNASSDASTQDLDLGELSYSIETGSDSGCGISGTSLTYTQAGSCVVKASRAGGNHWTPASQTVTYTISRANRSLTFNSASYDPSRNYANWSTTPPTLVSDPSAGSGDGTISYSLASGSTGCSVHPSTGAVSFTGAGTCKIQSSVGQGNKYNSANSSVLEIVVGKKQQAILNHSGETLNAPDGERALFAGSNATTLNTGITPVTYTIGSNTAGCAISASGSSLLFSEAGTCQVIAHSVANDHWTDATETVTYTINRSNRTATINATGNVTNAPAGTRVSIVSSPSAGSGSKTWTAGPSNVCTIDSSGIVTTLNEGACTIEASHGQTRTYNVANATMTLVVTARITSTPSPSPSPTATSSQSPQAVPSPSPTRNQPTRPIPPPAPSVAPAPSPSPSAGPSPAPIGRALPTPNVELPQVGSKQVPGAPIRNNTSVDTIDMGNGVKKSTASNILNTGTVTNSQLTNQLATIPQLAAETFTGFAKSSDTWVEVIGARTTGQFVVTPGKIADAFTIARALNESILRTSTDFAKISTVTAIAEPPQSQLLTGEITDDAKNTFSASQLDNPITLGNLDLSSAQSWLKIDAQATSFKPGTVVYLAVTTQPIILGAAVVAKDGTAEFTGYLPVDLLPDGGHNIRIVGTRELDGVTTSADGKVKVSNATLIEIQRFDAGTVSTVKVLGQNSTGGINGAIREIYLEKDTPWWTIWLLLIFIVTTLGIRLFVSRWTFTGRFVGSVLVGAATLPALIFGWITSSYNVMWISLLLTTASQLTTWLFPTKNLRRNISDK